MNIRPFSWRDLPLLNSYRHQGLFLDSSRLLIHGTALVPMGAFLTFLGPATRIYTYRVDNNQPEGRPLLGQVTYRASDTYARLSFLAPEDNINLADLSALSDHMSAELGAQGAFHLLADVNESSTVFQSLHRAGFAIYGRQRIWRIDSPSPAEPETLNWRESTSQDTIGLRSLYCNVVPGLVQQVEPFPKKNVRGFVLYQNGELRAFVEVKSGRYGVWAQPFVHPDAEGFQQQLLQLLQNLPHRSGRPIFVCIRSYQAWLESAIAEMGGQPGPADLPGGAAPGQADHGPGDLDPRGGFGLLDRLGYGLGGRSQIDDDAFLDPLGGFHARPQDADGTFLHPPHQGADFGRADINSYNNLIHRLPALTYRMVHPGIPH